MTVVLLAATIRKRPAPSDEKEKGPNETPDQEDGHALGEKGLP